MTSELIERIDKLVSSAESEPYISYAETQMVIALKACRAELERLTLERNVWKTRALNNAPAFTEWEEIEPIPSIED